MPFTPIPRGAALRASTFNSVFEQIDSQIAGIDGNVYSVGNTIDLTGLSSYQFTSLPSGIAGFRVFAQLRTNASGVAYLQLNQDSGAKYQRGISTNYDGVVTASTDSNGFKLWSCVSTDNPKLFGINDYDLYNQDNANKVINGMSYLPTVPVLYRQGCVFAGGAGLTAIGIVLTGGDTFANGSILRLIARGL